MHAKQNQLLDAPLLTLNSQGPHVLRLWMCFNTKLHHHKPKMFQPAPWKIKRVKEIENCYYSESLQLPTQKQQSKKNNDRWSFEVISGPFEDMSLEFPKRWQFSWVSQAEILQIKSGKIAKPGSIRLSSQWNHVSSYQGRFSSTTFYFLLVLFAVFLTPENKICSCRVAIPWTNLYILVSNYF